MASGRELALFYTTHGKEHGGEHEWEDVAQLFGEKSAESARSKAKRAGYSKSGVDLGPQASREVPETAFTVTSNRAQAVSRSPRIKTLPQLLKACEVDLDVWKVDRYELNKWEVGAKCVERNLEYTDGRADGYVKSSGLLTVAPLFQVKAWLSKRNPEPIFPTVQPIQCDLVFEPPPPPQGGMWRSVICADSQIGFRKNLRDAKLQPFHDRRALDVALQVIAAAKPDRVDWLGDCGDFTMWTDKYIRDPEFYYTSQPMFNEWHWWLAQTRAIVPHTQILLHQGNHEERLEKMLKLHLAEALELRAVDELHLPPAMSVQKLLALHKLQIRWIGGYPDDEDWLNERVCLSHGDTARAPGATGRKISQEVDYVSIVGHVHRGEMVIRKVHTRNGDHTVLGCCVPCLCHTDGRVPGSDRRNHWNQGVAIVDYDPEGTDYNLTMVPIHNGRAVWNGQLFEARNRVSEIAAAFPDWNW